MNPENKIKRALFFVDLYFMIDTWILIIRLEDSLTQLGGGLGLGLLTPATLQNVQPYAEHISTGREKLAKN